MLEWGATLYSTETYPLAASAESSRTPGEQIASFLGKDQPWPQLATSAMTGMVVSLDLIELSRELLVARNYHWDLHNYASLLAALEATHWHAFCFNENAHLRLQLQQRGFMNKNRAARTVTHELPHLLEQEVLSMEQLLFTVFRLYCHNKHAAATGAGSGKQQAFETKEAEVFAEPLVER